MILGRYFLVLVSLIILIFVPGCNKKKEVIYYSIPNTLKKACLFQKNSYWVYRNDSTAEIDCTYLKSDLVYGSLTYNNNDHIDYIIDYIQMPLQSSLFRQYEVTGKVGMIGNSPGYPFLAGVTNYGNRCTGMSTAYVLHDDTLTNHRGENYSECLNNSPKLTVYGGDEYVELGEYLNFNVNGIYFDKVRITRSIFFSSSFYFQDGDIKFREDTLDFFFSTGKGIVKIIYRVDTVSYYDEQSLPKRATISWSLLRYNAIQ
jgi:competence protein ComGC